MREIDRILCPVDLSDVSRLAADHAVLLARWYQASITALHVCSPVLISVSDFAPAGSLHPPALSRDEITKAREQVSVFFAAAGPGVVDVVVEDGRPANRILECARSLPADLIVIGTHGIGGFQHLLLGSVTEKVVRQATCPVLTVPPRAHTTSSLPFKRVLCPIDFSDSSLAALELAFSLAQESDADLQILHVCEWTTDDEPLTTRPIAIPEYRQLVERDIVERLEGLVPDSTRDACRPMTRVGHGKAYREILGVATEESADLIVMGVHGRNALDLMLFGSTTNQVVRRAACPVLTLRR
jgi:nucleotide-binding universal stress UspA family protein